MLEVFKMKLKAILPVAIQRIELLKQKCNVIEYREKLRKSGKYNQFDVRFSWDVGHAIFTTKEICSWYEKYQCNDDHITSLFKAACRKTGLL